MRIPEDPLTELLLAGSGEPSAALELAIERAAASRRVLIEGPRGAGHRAAALELFARGSGGTWLEVFADDPSTLGTLLSAGPETCVCLRRVELLPPGTQAALLDALGSPSSAEGPDSATFTGRLIATCEPFPAGAGQRRVDPDLEYLLGVHTVLLPSLRERADELGALASRALEAAAARHGRRLARLAPVDLERLLEQRPELELEELQLIVTLGLLRAADGQVSLEGGPSERSPLGRSLEEVEREHVLAVLRAVDGNRARAARELGINRSTLYNKLNAWGLGSSA
jgi:DNA-binding NtrC family response regulator